MTVSTHIPTSEPLDDETLLQDSRHAVNTLRAEIVNYTEFLAERDPEAAHVPPPEVKRLVNLITICLETENRLAKVKRPECGTDGHAAIDFDAIKSEIGRKLDRLRAAADPGAVS